MALSAFAQTKEIKGTVTDPQGNPVVGASVMVAELKNVGTVTDVDGLLPSHCPKARLPMLNHWLSRASE